MPKTSEDIQKDYDEERDYTGEYKETIWFSPREIEQAVDDLINDTNSPKSYIRALLDLKRKLGLIVRGD